MTSSPLNPDPTPQSEPFRWTRPALVQTLHDSHPENSSQRQFAAQHNVPRSTLQHWRARQARLDSDLALAAFLESPAGLNGKHWAGGEQHGGGERGSLPPPTFTSV